MGEEGLVMEEEQTVAYPPQVGTERSKRVRLEEEEEARLIYFRQQELLLLLFCCLVCVSVCANARESSCVYIHVCVRVRV